MEVEGGDISSIHTTLHSVILDRFLNLTFAPSSSSSSSSSSRSRRALSSFLRPAAHRLASAGRYSHRSAARFTVVKESGLTGWWTPYRMNRKISANSNITQHISPDDEITGDYKSAQVCVNPVSAKPKYPPASFGVASDFMQKDYLIPKPPSTRSFETTKPLRH